MSDLNEVTAISAADGRYRSKVTSLSTIVSEYGLMKYRVQVECEWFIFLASLPQIKEFPELNESQIALIRSIYQNFSINDANSIKQHESKTNHDVKAVEYFVKDKICQDQNLKDQLEWVHFCCTSEDINNTAYALMLDAGIKDISEEMTQLITQLDELANQYAQLGMLSRTHGQTASPTTLGKELKNVAARLNRQHQQLTRCEILGKFNGAVGNFNAHISAYPEVDWPAVSAQFVTNLGLTNNAYTTQIEPHDYVAEVFHCLIRFNQVLLDFNRDMWSYISINYFKQKTVAGETGSSTMPHKVNPIDFENSEGNIGIANALLDHMSQKLQVSRWQRDLSDSTVLRNIGSTLAHCKIAYAASLKGLSRVEVNESAIAQDLNEAWEVLAEPVQTIMRKYQLSEPYERLKSATRGQAIDAASFEKIINSLELPQAAYDELKSLRPENYLGCAHQLALSRL